MNTQTSSLPICIRGRYFWRGEDRFFVRGVAYQDYDTKDPISDDRLPQLKRDIALFKELGLNTLYVFFIDNTKVHEKAMKLLEEAGIYVLTKVSTPLSAISRRAPYESYNSATMASFFRTVDSMASYPNTLGLLVASELINSDANVSVTPVLKAAVRDLKRHMTLKNKVVGQRILPIGYNGATSGARDQTILEYLSAGDRFSSIDFWTCKVYSWIGDSSMARSGYDDMVNGKHACIRRLCALAEPKQVDQLKHTIIPIFISEYGNSTHQPRLFQETKAIYSAPMSQVFSGGCVYEFWQASNYHGLVELIRKDADPRFTSYQTALSRAEDQNKVKEKYETEQGLLLIYHDFANYKANLAAAVQDEMAWKSSLWQQQEVETEDTGALADSTLTTWPWEPEFQEPASCIDWELIEGLMRSKVGA